MQKNAKKKKTKTQKLNEDGYFQEQRRIFSSTKTKKKKKKRKRRGKFLKNDVNVAVASTVGRYK